MKFNLTKLREERNLSMEQLAKLANTGLSNIGRIEAGGANPTAKVLCSLAKALDVTLNDLVDCK